jgi:HEAT repeat protein
LNAADLNDLWSDLAGDAAKADRALWALALTPKLSLPFLKKRLWPAAPADAQQVAKLIADLNSDSFTVRDKAARMLEELGEAAEAALRRAIASNPPLEVRMRVDQLLKLRQKYLIRVFRAIEAVEYIGTPEARQVLEAVEKESPNPRAAEAAGGALERMAKVRVLK